MSCQRGGVQLPWQAWGGEHADNDAAAERFLEASTLWAPISSPPGTTGGATRRAAARYRRRGLDGNSHVAEDGGAAAVCAICLAGLEEAEAGRQAVAELGACSHVFHAACIDAWAGTGAAATCPLCGAPMTPTPWEDDGQSLPAP
ncbi:E3 ubiquitin-protein ligase ATL6-like [Panicum hallii]|uniref:E3 ubiquitin-protein ligase ATL6-like n=1 Tax=Panicum hallii TaxID=206008 RepID=UPI000DF4D422|nr:E3 ubiquitin-protein ligase ATL6-like [Panicum hallii]